MRPTRIFAIVALALLLSAGCSADDATDSAEPTDDDTFEATEERAVAGIGVATEDEASTDAPDDGAADDVPPPIPASTSAVLAGDRLVKEGTMTVEVPADGYEQGFQRVVSAAHALGGSVIASSSASTSDGGTSGSITVRVPVDRYEDLLMGVDGVGEVRRRDITTRDVTAEFVDTESRLRHARAQERFYLGLLDEAQGVADAIAVQQHLDGIQQSIERLQGQLNVLEDRTSFSTLTVELVEPGASPLLAAGERPRLAEYLAQARDAFVTVVGSTIVVLVAVAPVLVVLAVGLGAWRLRARRPVAATVAGEA